MAYCLSYCFVTSLVYMVSWRQQSAQAGARANGWRNRICFAGSGAHLPARHTATCAAACTAACTAASATLRRSHCRATGRPRQCLVMPCQCLTTKCKCPASALPMWLRLVQIERPERRVHDMLPAEEVPHVDVFICTYSGDPPHTLLSASNAHHTLTLLPPPLPQPCPTVSASPFLP